MRYWSFVYLFIAVACTAVFIYAPLDQDWWLPPNHSKIGIEIDHLFFLILGITGVAFIGTQLLLAYALWTSTARPGGRATYFHGSQRLEVIWTIIPSAILVFIGLYQLGPWAEIKFRASQPKVAPLAEITGRQFQWMIRYPGPDGRLDTPDDLHTVNDLRFVKKQDVVVYLRSKDVIHSFFIPELRIKQDAVPGLEIPVWFDCDEAGPYELVCAELCGWGHYKMRGMITVYATQAEFDKWQAEELEKQAADQFHVASSAAQPEEK